MVHHMTCQTKTLLSHDGGDLWEGAVQFLVGHVGGSRTVLGWSCGREPYSSWLVMWEGAVQFLVGHVGGSRTVLGWSCGGAMTHF